MLRSKTSVDDVRELIDFLNINQLRQITKFLYVMKCICFHLHLQLCLKTLEEPPPYLKFIFASTEPKKIPVTIISRCQRYDLSRVNSQELFEYLVKIKDLENGKISEDVIKLIVKLSEGSVRDSLSCLIEQC